MTYPLPAAKTKQAAHLIRSVKHTVALTGGGIPTPSGIDDLRLIGVGLWERYNPTEVAALSAFHHNPHLPIDPLNTGARLVINNKSGSDSPRQPSGYNIPSGSRRGLATPNDRGSW